MPLRYLSPEWLAEGRRRAAASKELLAAIQGIDATIVNIVTGTPGGKTVYVRYGFRGGDFEELTAGTDPSIPETAADFKVTATYETFCELAQGKLSIALAFLQRRLKVEGNLPRAMRLVKPLDTMNRLLRQIPTEY